MLQEMRTRGICLRPVVNDDDDPQLATCAAHLVQRAAERVWSNAQIDQMRLTCTMHASSQELSCDYLYALRASRISL